MGRKKQIKLPTDLVNAIQKIEDTRHRSAWRKQFKNEYAVKKMFEECIEQASKPIPENLDECERELYARQRERIPELERKLIDIQERIVSYEVSLKKYLNGNQEDISRYALVCR